MDIQGKQKLSVPNAKFAVYFDESGNELAIHTAGEAGPIETSNVMKLLDEKDLLKSSTTTNVKSFSIISFHGSPACIIWIGGIPIRIC